MADQDPKDQNQRPPGLPARVLRRLAEIVETTAGPVTGTAAAFVTGDPMVALAALSGVTTSYEALKLHRVVRLYDDLKRRLDDVEARLDAAAEDARLAALVGRGLEVAEQSRDDEQLSLCGSILAHGLEAGADDDRIDRMHLLLDVAARLHRDHIRILRFIGQGDHTPDGTFRLAPVQMRTGTPASAAGRVLPGRATLAEPLVAALAGLGLVRDVSGQTLPTARSVFSQEIPPDGWIVTGFGELLLEHLNDLPGA